MIFVYIVSILGGVFFGLGESINKNITEKQFSASAYAFIQNFFNLLIYLIPFILFFQLPPFGIVYIYLLLCSIFVLVGNVLLIRAYKTEDISNVSILQRSNLVLTFFIGVTLLSETFTILKLVGIFVIFLGIFVIFFEGKFSFTSGSFLALIVGVLWAVGTYFQKISSVHFTTISFIVIDQFVKTVLLFLVPATRKDVSGILQKYMKKIIASRIIAVVAMFLVFWSIQKGNISVVNTNTETFYLLSSVFIGVMFLKEKKHVSKKFIGSLLCVAGILLLNLF